MKNKKAATAETLINPESPKLPVFQGTIAGKKFLFLADNPELTPVVEVPKDKTPEEVAGIAHEIVARSRANHEAVKALIREWVKAQRANNPVFQAQLEAKAKRKAEKAQALKEAKAIAKAEKSKARNEAKEAKALEKNSAKLAKQQAKTAKNAK